MREPDVQLYFAVLTALSPSASSPTRPGRPLPLVRREVGGGRSC